MLGEDYTVIGSRDLLIEKNHPEHPQALARLRGKRLLVCGETREGARLDEALVKTLTGNEKMTGHFMGQNEIEFYNQAKPWQMTNHKPRITSDTEALWDRLIMIPCEVRISDADCDPSFGARLKEEYPGILKWAVEGCLDWQHNGLRPPQAVLDFTSEYRREENIIQRFLDDCCRVESRLACLTAELFAAYKRWCETGNERAGTQNAFGRKLTAMGFVDEVPNRGQCRGQHVRCGLDLTNDVVDDGR